MPWEINMNRNHENIQYCRDLKALEINLSFYYLKCWDGRFRKSLVLEF